jgi:hypothetical protein
MFESRLQVSQVFLGLSAILVFIAIPTLMFGSIAVAIFCLVLSHASAAAGCYVYAETKGYPPLLGIPIGVGLGVMGSVIILILPDETAESPFAAERKFGEEGLKNARKRDKGYEVLEDDE